MEIREVKDHVVNPANDKLIITVEDEPGAGGASHLYMIRGFSMATNPSCPFMARYGWSATESMVLFQNGPIDEHGVNGITNEVLLAIVADRLRSFQAGPFSCRHNAIALTKVEEAMHWLQQRTIERMRRGVEVKTIA